MTDMKEWRLLKYENMNPCDATTLEDTLRQEISNMRSPPTVFAFTTEPCITYALRCDTNGVNMVECKKREIPIVRHIIGSGSPLFNDPSMITLFIIHRPNDKTGPSNIKQARTLLVETLKGTFAEFGLELKRSEHRPAANEFVVNNRKISPLVVNFSEGCIVCLIGILTDFNYDLATKVLNVPPSKFENKPHKTMRDWVTTLKRELGRDVSIEELMNIFIRQFEENFEVSLVHGELTDRERELTASLREKHESDEWIKYGKWSPVKDYWRPK